MIIGLTGSIGSGKSTAAKRLAALGALVLDADKICRELVEAGQSGLERIKEAFGESIVDGDGALDRRALAAIVFADEEKRRTLNGILHPMVLDTLLTRAEQSFMEAPERIVVWEVPLLIECGWCGYCDEVWLVQAAREVRIERVMKRDCCSEADAARRMDAQMSDEEKAEYATLIFDNSTTEAALDEKLDEAFGRIMGEKA